MLAERRTKVNYVLNPRNKNWSAENSNFGKKLMEKMGWSNGKGLGKDEQGDTEHIVVKYKNDSKGMGYSGPVDDPVLHQNDFAEILAKLNSSHNTPDKPEEVISLEKRSESSKARVHYKKFTRGKDISRYSSKDLECILGNGKKKEKPEEKPNVKLETEPVDEKHGVETVDGGLMRDYFRKKMVAKGYWKPTIKKEEIEQPGDCIEEESGHTGFGFGFKMETDNEADKAGDLPVEQSTSTEPEKKKKKKKSKSNTHVDNEASSNQDEPVAEFTTGETKKKKKKSKKANQNSEAELIQEPEQMQLLEAPLNEKSKKKKKRKHEEETESELKDCAVDDEVPIKKKKSKKAKSNKVDSDLAESENATKNFTEIVKKKKGKKCKKAK